MNGNRKDLKIDLSRIKVGPFLRPFLRKSWHLEVRNIITGTSPLGMCWAPKAQYPLLAWNQSRGFVYAYYVLRTISYILSQGSIFSIAVAYAEKMRELQEQTISDGRSYTDIDILHQVLGPKPSYMRGLGRAVKPPRSSGSSSTRVARQLRKAQLEIDRLKAEREVEVEQMRIEQEAEMERMRVEQQQEMKELEDRLMREMREHINDFMANSTHSL
ncbi:hypothetical protein CJ030_MR1G015683 [Morella rubra]|uniref:Uncharacterized protein n=1 Tax=Morella rubra TaxID=262757 RepID=A0A6A1WNG5_9ROSI|nr:hypothetical protein CJ030_MR1G015683 [Morella rubra]